MKASYKITLGNESIEFESEPLNFDKCIQIKRISEANKLIKGFYIRSMSYSMNGLESIHAQKMEQYSIPDKFREPIILSEIEIPTIEEIDDGEYKVEVKSIGNYREVAVNRLDGKYIKVGEVIRVKF